MYPFVVFPVCRGDAPLTCDTNGVIGVGKYACRNKQHHAADSLLEDYYGLEVMAKREGNFATELLSVYLCDGLAFFLLVTFISSLPFQGGIGRFLPSFVSSFSYERMV